MINFRDFDFKSIFDNCPRAGHKRQPQKMLVGAILPEGWDSNDDSKY